MAAPLLTRAIVPNPAGTNLIRYLSAVVTAGGDAVRARDTAELRFRDTPLTVAALHELVGAPHVALVRGAVTGVAGLTARSELAREAWHLLAGVSAFAQVAQIGRRADFLRPVNVETDAVSGAWLAQGEPAPLAAAGFTATTLAYKSAANISVMSKEAFRHSPTSEAALRQSLLVGLARLLDDSFLNPARAASATEPGSITSVAQEVASAGSTGANLASDLDGLLSNIGTAGTTLRYVMRPITYHRAVTKLSSLGVSTPPGTLAGIPVILGGGPTGQILLLDCAGLVIAVDDPEVDLSFEGTVEMTDGSLTQSGVDGTGASQVSLWQTNAVGLRAAIGASWASLQSNGGSPSQTAAAAFVNVGY